MRSRCDEHVAVDGHHELLGNGAGVPGDASRDCSRCSILAIFVIYMVLGILYESFIHPITILSGLPFAAFGALARRC